MLNLFINSKLRKATYKILEDGRFFGEVKGLKGVWAEAKTLEDCREQLREVIEDWVLVKIRFGERIPGLTFDFDKRKRFEYA